MKKLVRPTMWGAICFTIALFMLSVDTWEILTQTLVVIPLYGLGTLYFIWSDYVGITMPVACVWMALAYGFWNPGGTR